MSQARTEEEQLTDEANRLLRAWLFTGVATLDNGRMQSIAEAEDCGLLRLCMDLSKRAPRKRSMSINPDALRPQKTAKEAKP